MRSEVMGLFLTVYNFDNAGNTNTHDDPFLKEVNIFLQRKIFISLKSHCLNPISITNNHIYCNFKEITLPLDSISNIYILAFFLLNRIGNFNKLITIGDRDEY